MVAQHITWHKIFVLLVITLCLLLLIIFGLPVLAKPIAKILPQQLAQHISEYISIPFENSFGVCKNPQGLAALNKLTKHLSSAAQIQQPISVIVINDPDANNAFATPNGKILLFAGLLAATDNQQQLAGIIAHEIAHTMLLHPEIAIVRDNGLFILLLAMFGKDPTIQHHLLTLNFSRQAEFAADNLAVELLNQTQIGTAGLIDFLKKINSPETNSLVNIGDLLATHPAISERIRKIQQTDNNGQIKSRPLLTDSEWQALKNICN